MRSATQRSLLATCVLGLSASSLGCSLLFAPSRFQGGEVDASTGPDAFSLTDASVDAPTELVDARVTDDVSGPPCATASTCAMTEYCEPARSICLPCDADHDGLKDDPTCLRRTDTLWDPSPTSALHIETIALTDPAKSLFVFRQGASGRVLSAERSVSARSHIVRHWEALESSHGASQDLSGFLAVDARRVDNRFVAGLLGESSIASLVFSTELGIQQRELPLSAFTSFSNLRPMTPWVGLYEATGDGSVILGFGAHTSTIDQTVAVGMTVASPAPRAGHQSLLVPYVHTGTANDTFIPPAASADHVFVAPTVNTVTVPPSEDLDLWADHLDASGHATPGFLVPTLGQVSLVRRASDLLIFSTLYNASGTLRTSLVVHQWNCSSSPCTYARGVDRDLALGGTPAGYAIASAAVGPNAQLVLVADREGFRIGQVVTSQVVADVVAFADGQSIILAAPLAADERVLALAMDVNPATIPTDTPTRATAPMEMILARLVVNMSGAMHIDYVFVDAKAWSP